MATVKKEMGLVKIEQESINEVKSEIIGSKQTIGDFYKEAASKLLLKKKKKK
mgnify:CR=1 FL=1